MYLKIGKIHFHFHFLPFGSSWSVKCLNFWEKLTIWTVHHTFLENRHPKVTENPCFVLSPMWAVKEGISSWTTFKEFFWNLELDKWLFSSKYMENNYWIKDVALEQDLNDYVLRNLKIKKNFWLYDTWLWTLVLLEHSNTGRMLRFFDINYIHYDTSLEMVQAAVQKEINEPSKLLGYRALDPKLKMQYEVQVPRRRVHEMLQNEDSKGLEFCRPSSKKKERKRLFSRNGPLNAVSLDGHEKLYGYQNWTFPLGVYGCLDTYSRKVLFLSVCYSNSNPMIIGRKYLQFLHEVRTLPRFIWIDCGTGNMATIQTYLSSNVSDLDDPVDSVIYGPSTTNKIDRWWRDLHDRLEK